MTILGLGVDLNHVPRIAGLFLRNRSKRLAVRILSPREFTQWKRLQEKAENFACAPELVQFLAVRWSVKEAAYKALYPTVRPTWKELTYDRGSGKPSLLYHPVIVKDAQKVGRIHVSVSHDGEYVYSSVCVEEPHTTTDDDSSP